MEQLTDTASIERARKYADSLPEPDGLLFRGVAVTEFSDDQLRKILGSLMRSLERERERHQHTLGMF